MKRKDYRDHCYACFRITANKNFALHYNKVKKDYLGWKAYVFKSNRGWKSKITKEILQELITKQKNICPICADDISKIRWEIDHIVPMALEGSHEPSNLQIVCRPCNRGKWDMGLEYYIAHCRKVALKHPA